jgi:hypothetical protein
MLRDAGHPIGADAVCVEARADWARGLRGCLTWGVPIAILLATPWVCECYLVRRTDVSVIQRTSIMTQVQRTP